jgi:hypothetical protein
MSPEEKEARKLRQLQRKREKMAQTTAEIGSGEKSYEDGPPSIRLEKVKPRRRRHVSKTDVTGSSEIKG